MASTTRGNRSGGVEFIREDDGRVTAKDIETGVASFGSENDSSYSPPETVEEFGFWEYTVFVNKNWETLEEYFAGNQGLVTSMISDVGMVRNALFHFRTEVDRVLIEVAHEEVRAAAQAAM